MIFFSEFILLIISQHFRLISCVLTPNFHGNQVAEQIYFSTIPPQVFIMLLNVKGIIFTLFSVQPNVQSPFYTLYEIIFLVLLFITNYIYITLPLEPLKASYSSKVLVTIVKQQREQLYSPQVQCTLQKINLDVQQ